MSSFVGFGLSLMSIGSPTTTVTGRLWGSMPGRVELKLL